MARDSGVFPARAAAAIALAVAAALPAPAHACALDGGDVAVQRGLMNWSYPDALYVQGALAAAQHDGRIERAPPADASPAAGAYALLRVRASLEKLRARFALAPRAGPRPAIAVVLLEPMLWSRIEAASGALRLTVHVDGPRDGDTVVVTEAPVLSALADGRLSSREALALGLLRIYGRDDAAAVVRELLLAEGT
jgi:hypothetical protein